MEGDRRRRANTFLGLGSDLEFGGPENESGGGIHDTLEEIGGRLLVISTSCTPPRRMGEWSIF